MPKKYIMVRTVIKIKHKVEPIIVHCNSKEMTFFLMTVTQNPCCTVILLLYYIIFCSRSAVLH